MARSTVERLLLTELASDRTGDEYDNMLKALVPSVTHFYSAVRAWVARERLDAVLIYNGRMDLTRAALEAVTDLKIPFVTVETPWSGHGLALTPNAPCLSLGEAHRIIREFRDKPLTETQARIAGRIIASRFLRRNNLEWRVYNEGAVAASWPEPNRGPRVLVLPSSRNEVEGHPDWTAEWSDYPEVFETAIQKLGASGPSVIVRCHPNWGEAYGRRTGVASEKAYTDWARERGYTLFASRDKADTYSLLDGADHVLVNGSTAGLEAAALGKTVTSLGASWYSSAGFANTVTTRAELEKLGAVGVRRTPDELRRLALRYVYSYARRLTQFAREVRATSASTKTFAASDVVERLDRMLATGRVEPDDPRVAADESHEDRVLQLMVEGRWEDLHHWEEPQLPIAGQGPHRRVLFRWIDAVRRLRPVGDRV